MMEMLRKLGSGKAVYRCQCGAETTAFVNNVASGHTRSCGCVRRAATSARTKTHGHRSNGQRSRAYVCWQSMRSRCDNPNSGSYADYGGRGIYYAPRWISFINFLADMGEPPPGKTLDRRENDGMYYPENCRWATRAEQNLNKRNCVRYEFNGKNQTLAEWSRETGIGYITMLKRIQRGVPIELALTTRGYLRFAPTNDSSTGLVRFA